MSDVSAVRSSYANRRSPGAMAAAIALNAGVIAALIAIPVTIDVIRGEGPLITHDVPIDYVPPPEPDQPPPKPETKDIQKLTNTVTPPLQPTSVDTLVKLDQTGPKIALNEFPPPEVGTGKVTPLDPPVAPVLVKARPDPRYADNFRPDYPPAMRREGLEGSVTVRVIIDERGRVVSVDLVSATNPAFFEAAKAQALKSWRFAPATQDGTAVRSEQTMTLRFRLES